MITVNIKLMTRTMDRSLIGEEESETVSESDGDTAMLTVKM